MRCRLEIKPKHGTATAASEVMNLRAILAGFWLIFCSGIAFAAEDVTHTLIISVPDQRMVVLENGVPVARYPISTSKYGVGDCRGRYTTPLGNLQVAQKIGDNAPVGAVFKGRRWTGEVIRPNAFGRDPIVTRILWLRGLDSSNRNAYNRAIYIHGTPEERLIGRPASYGCIRMRSQDVVKVFNTVGVGARISIVNAPLYRAMNMVVATRNQAGFAG
jgi:lipoprotein-anchoring transpeptidase ErfK/SrfK